jgi:hypothetical protein
MYIGTQSMRNHDPDSLTRRNSREIPLHTDPYIVPHNMRPTCELMIIVILNDGRIRQKATIFRYVAEGASEVFDSRDSDVPFPGPNTRRGRSSTDE